MEEEKKSFDHINSQELSFTACSDMKKIKNAEDGKYGEIFENKIPIKTVKKIHQITKLRKRQIENS